MKNLHSLLPRSVYLLTILVFDQSALHIQAQSTNADDFAAIQANAKKAFVSGGGVDSFIRKYCAKCHGNKTARAGLNFQRSLRAPGKVTYRKHWKLAVTFLESKEMPPEDEKQPTDEERRQFVTWINQIKYLSPKDPGPFVIRRLTRVEYGNTLRDLFGVDPSVADDLPDDVTGEGYLNSLSPLQSEQYLQIANEVVNRIVAPDGKPPTDIQQRLFGETPAAGAELQVAKKVAQSIARNAFRRPPSDEEVAVLLSIYKLARDNQLNHVEGLRLLLKAILVSPQFLFITPAGELETEDDIVPLDGFQLASRLSYLLWSTLPDAKLLELAERGQLHERSTLRTQVKRMLKDDRSRALFDGFGVQWLRLKELKTKTFDTKKFPLITDEMRQAMVDEARLFFESIFRENQSIVRFVDSDYTFMNGTLATLYGLEESVTGPAMRRVNLTDPNRGGILGLPATLATTSFPNRTSPVNRGVWVLEQILGEHVPPAPANVPALEKQDRAKVENLTLRQRTELHQSKASCANCHRILDPIGFGLENFDAIGRWRENDDSGGPIDSAGKLPNGDEFNTPRELKAIIAARKNDLARNLTERFLAYALCRRLEGYDEVVVDDVVQAVARDGYRMQTLITEIVTSYPFTQRRVR